jgi:hypothetical protein
MRCGDAKIGKLVTKRLNPFVPRFELFLLGDGEKKCTEAADTRTFHFNIPCQPFDPP